LIASGGCGTVLVCAGDVLTPHVNRFDRANRMVFGDAGSATIVTRGDARFVFDTHTDGSGAGNLIIPEGGARKPRASQAGLHMDGMSVLNFAINVVPDFIESVLQHAGWAKEELDFFGLHQANHFVVANLRRILELSPDVLPFECADVGNTGPASIPLLLSLRHEGLRAAGSLAKTLLCGYGVGYSAAGVCLSLDGTIFLPPVVAKAPIAA